MALSSGLFGSEVVTGIELRSLRHDTGGFLLDVESLEVPPGGRLALFGPNGSGKTTLLRLLAGTLPGGPAIPAAYLPQRPYAFRGSARRNLGMGLDAPAMGRALELAGRLGVGELLDRPGRGLSGGERQRLRLAGVLARPEDIVLLDEPFAAVDARERAAVGRVVSGALGGRTAVVVTHDRDDAVMLADTLAVMVDGRIRQVGPIRDVLGLPADDAVAAVLGIANAHAGRVTAADGPLVVVDVGGAKIWGVGDVEGDAVALFGAETVTVFAGREGSAGSARNRWVGRVDQVRELGRLVEIVVDAGFPVVAVLTPGSADALGIRAGAQVTLAVKATAVRVVGR
ncbi:MAG: ATP-binding cassette domain-containing protein [Actinomycetota bacterium]|nr:ATP-binding cassette domain-containing protein [Actinomycetota bacterium]